MNSRALLVAGALAGLAAPVLQAQTSVRTAGTVVRGGDSAPVAGARVVLHRVGLATQGPIDTVATDRTGRFAFRFSLDTTASYLLSARHAGIEYFSQPISANGARPDTAVGLVVFDTSSTVPVSTKSRTLVIGAPDPIGTRTVIDWLVLENRGTLTRVEADSLDPTWSAPLPTAARNPTLGDSRISPISPEAILFRNDSVSVIAPLSPGNKELLLQYDLPGGTRQLTVGVHGVDSVDVFLEEAGGRVTTPGWVARDSQLFEGRSFRRFQASVGADPVLVVTLPRGPAGNELLPLLVGATAVLLVALAWYRLRRPVAAASSD